MTTKTLFQPVGVDHFGGIIPLTKRTFTAKKKAQEWLETNAEKLPVQRGMIVTVTECILVKSEPSS